VRLLACAALAALAAAASTAAAEPPQLKAKRAQAAEILREISSLDERLSVLSERYDGARVHLHAVEARLASERVALKRARKQYHGAVDRLAQLVVSLYTSSTPSSLDVILGARSVGELLSLADAQAAITQQRDEIAANARVSRKRLQAVVAALQADRADAARAVAKLGATRRSAERALAQRQRLLASVRGQIAQIQERERLRQQRLLAAARARLAAERARIAAAAERAARQRAAAARAAARARARSEAAATRMTSTVETVRQPGPTPEAVTTTPPPAPTTTVAAQPPSGDAAAADTTSTVTTPAPAPAPATPAPAGGHPEAAQIALGYIGVPYRWGGSTPDGFDCSGLVSYVYAQLGIDLPHYAAAQYGYGTPVARDQLQPGDLVFFDNLAHVGIYIGGDQFVAAPHTGTDVRIDSLDEAWYSSHYVGARRLT
jgi:cell wall-associated NlpC family hydrolase